MAVPTIVVFDIGNVLIEWDPRHLYRRVFEDEARMDWFLANVCTPDWNRAQDGGRPWAEAEAEAIASHPAFEREIRLYRARWHDMVPGTIDGSMDLLGDLEARGVPLYAITNFAADTFAEAQERFPVLKRFRGVVVSGTERLLKPDPRIYRRLAERDGVDLTRSVFLDDSAANCAAAAGLGMAAVHFETAVQARAALAGLGLPV